MFYVNFLAAAFAEVHLAAKGRVPRQVITKFTMDPQPAYARPIPSLIDENPNFPDHNERLGEARTLLSQGYDYSSYEESKPVRRTSSRVRKGTRSRK